jgi:hypothetical protein
MDLTEIQVVIGHKIFYTTKDTLKKSTYFMGILEFDPTIKSITVVDRSPKLFSKVLEFMRNNNYPYPSVLYQELDFYGVAYDKDSLYNPDSKMLSKLNILECRLNDLEHKIDVELSMLKQCHICGKKCTENRKYCNEHTCNLLYCGKRRYKGMYCYLHACRLENCNNHKFPEKKRCLLYCDNHNCEWNCSGLRVKGTERCKNHQIKPGWF